VERIRKYLGFIEAQVRSAPAFFDGAAPREERWRRKFIQFEEILPRFGQRVDHLAKTRGAFYRAALVRTRWRFLTADDD
jgi:hypothetical protein